MQLMLNAMEYPNPHLVVQQCTPPSMTALRNYAPMRRTHNASLRLFGRGRCGVGLPELPDLEACQFTLCLGVAAVLALKSCGGIGAAQRFDFSRSAGVF